MVASSKFDSEDFWVQTLKDKFSWLISIMSAFWISCPWGDVMMFINNITEFTFWSSNVLYLKIEWADFGINFVYQTLNWKTFEYAAQNHINKLS